jgi:acyl-CoA hydrolase
MSDKGLVLHDLEQCVDAIIERVGKRVVFGMPLGLGKPSELINAMYARAKQDPDIHLKILTALSLEKPAPGSALEAAFLGPFIERVYGDCPDLDYMTDLRRKQLPPNVEVSEFFFKPGSFMGNPIAQQSYISCNYTHAARDVFAQGCNVAAQSITSRETNDETRISLSSNPDTGPELVEMLRAAEAAGERRVCVVGQVNQNLPFMGNDAEVSPDMFDLILDNPKLYTTLFSTPKLSVATPDYMIGLNASALIKDGGTLQVGIGALGDAIVYAAKMRQEHNNTYQQVLGEAGILKHAGELIDAVGGTGVFEKGLYGATEMFVDGFLHLFKAGILKRKVYDFWALQQLLNEGRCNPDQLSTDVLDGLEALGLRVIRTKDFEILQHHGFFNDATRYDNGYIIAPDGSRIIANVADPEARRVIGEQCLGNKLRNGVVLHGGFFLGPNDFYQGLRDLSDDERSQICMTGVYKVNQLDHNPRLYKQQRLHARFINTGIMATMSGAIVSDGVEDGRVVSGVGGQFNFVDMAHHLPTGRSLLMIRSLREKDGVASSNIVWNYGHCTIPRHLRDIVITEYGIAELRSKTDAEVIKALLNVTDSRFQQNLLETAKRAGKIEAGYEIPEAFRHNTPQRLEEVLHKHRAAGLFPAFPLGTDLTKEEQQLGKALKGLKARAESKGKLALMWDAYQVKSIPAAATPFLRRMQLESPQNLQQRITQKLLILELQTNGVL